MSSDSDSTYYYRPEHIRVKRTFTKEDDKALTIAVQSCPTCDWKEISKKLGKWSPRQCRERWKNYVDPTLITTKWTSEEDAILLDKHRKLGTNWSKIKEFLPGRATNAIKNRLSFLRQRNIEPLSPPVSEAIDENEMYMEILRIGNLINHH